MKNLEAADLLEDSISDSFCRKTNLKKIIAKAVSWVHCQKPYTFCGLKARESDVILETLTFVQFSGWLA